MRCLRLDGSFFAIGIESTVLISNVRIVFAYWTLLTLTFGLLVAQFVVFRQFESSTDCTDSMSVKMSVPPLSLEEKDATEAKAATYPFCSEPRPFKYVFTQQRSFEISGCLETCDLLRNKTTLGKDCVPAASLTFRSGPSVFFTSLRHTTMYDYNLVTRNTKFAPLVESMRLALNIDYKVREAHTAGILTAVIKIKGGGKKQQVERFYDHGEIPEFSVAQILSLAGLPHDFLNQQQGNFGENKEVEEGHINYPIGRIVGALIRASVFCGNSEHAMDEVDLQGRFDLSKHKAVCVVSFEAKNGQWSWRDFVEQVGMQGQYIYTYDSGIEIVTDIKGVCRSLDLNSMLLSLSSAIVFLGVPKTIIVAFMTVCLGRLSIIFKRAISKPFDLEAELTAMATRAIAHTHSLHLLGGGKSAGIVRGRELKRHLMKVLQGKPDGLSTPEAEALVRFIYRGICRWVLPSTTVKHSMKDELMRIVSDSWKKTYTHEDDAVSLDQLGGVTTIGETVDFQTMVHLFDVEKPHGILERMFMPSKLARALNESSEMRKLNLENSGAASLAAAAATVGASSPTAGKVGLFSSMCLSSESCEVRRLTSYASGSASLAAAAARGSASPTMMNSLSSTRNSPSLRVDGGGSLACLVGKIDRLESQQRQINAAAEASITELVRRSDAAADGLRMLERRFAELEVALAAAPSKDGGDGARAGDYNAKVLRLAVTPTGQVAAAAPPPPGDGIASHGVDQDVASLERRVAVAAAAVTPAVAVVAPAPPPAAAAAVAAAAGAAQPEGAAVGAPQQLWRCTDRERDREVALLRQVVAEIDAKMHVLLQPPLAAGRAFDDTPVEPSVVLYEGLAASGEETRRPWSLAGDGTQGVSSVAVTTATTSRLNDEEQLQDRVRPLSTAVLLGRATNEVSPANTHS